ncbi:hypothetical protein EK0264_12235 [Epidermidibacterium keratini]|uniref:Aldolase n=1 Tax=Epidermidibacterium keratini TaxID=1891644 RepID=A0A7L4YPI6_9ACTN|nr:hypothetical protein [Epidermidibacterium keratini]QHC00978.1 hypothetical protein EK0264_12235 [Epidermidibacterium keratini]
MPNRLTRGLVDDAGLFPPTSLQMRDALARNARDRAAGPPMLTNRFLVTSADLPAMLDALPAGQEIEIGLIHGGDVDSLSAALEQAGSLLRHIELKGLDAWDGVPDDLPVYVEAVPRSGLPEVIEATQSAKRSAPTGVKVRCGGVSADLFPSVDELATALRAIISAGVPMKATAGLHSAVRNTNPQTGFDHHGFVNLLVAIDTALRDGDVAAALAERDPETLAQRARGIDREGAEQVRSVLVSYGSCSTSSPVQQARELRLL